MSAAEEKLQFISREKAESLLLPHGLRIGGWNELADAGEAPSQHITFCPGRGGAELYVLAHHLSNWVTRDGWTLVQFDNSTLPLDIELDTVRFIFSPSGGRWDFTHQKTMLVGSSNGCHNSGEAVALIIFFGLLFEWHFYLVGEGAERGRRLGVQDGTVYFFGFSEALAEAAELVERVTHAPLNLPDGY